MKISIFLISCALVGAFASKAPAASVESARNGILADLSIEAKNANPEFVGFSAERGKVLFNERHGGGKPETPSCITCHGKVPQAMGETRAGKPIEPMAVSVTADRYADPAKVAKWFRRNCRSVLGRDCTAQEKGDFITFMLAQ